MILIIDAGSTKTTWCIVDNDGNICIELKTPGINPVTMKSSDIEAIVNDIVVPGTRNYAIDSIYYYGAGVIDEIRSKVVKESLAAIGPDIEVEVRTDLLGACRALLGNHPGLVGILGTGSNSCYYDGHEIVDNTPPLGYILGDEGSGAAIGKRFIHHLFKRQLHDELVDAWREEINMTVNDVIDRVYRRPGANTWLASLVPFIKRHIGHPTLDLLVRDEFAEYFEYNLLNYMPRNIGFIGSVASTFETQLRMVARHYTFEIIGIMPDPMPGLIAYHTAEKN